MEGIFQRIGGFFLDIIESGVVAIGIFFVVYLFLVQPHQVNGNSMVPTLLNKEYLLTDKISYRLGKPERGDIVVFHAPPEANCPTGTGCDYIKRIIGLPGDQVLLGNSTFYVNGQPLSEAYLPADFETLPGTYMNRVNPLTLGQDEFLVVGDNRPYSSDGRAWGPITSKEIVGKAFFRYWPLNKVGLITHATYGEGAVGQQAAAQ